MQIHNVQQGTAAWLKLREEHFTASEAPALMSASPYMNRSDLLRLKAGVSEPENVDSFKQSLFDKGHELEAMARTLVEQDIGEDLFPVVCTDNGLLASVDGMTEDGGMLFEHKIFNAELAKAVDADELPPAYYWQLEQQLLVTGAEYVLFVCSDGTLDNWRQLDYYPVKGRAEELQAAWKQFDTDLKTFKESPKAAPVEKPQGKMVTELPALLVEITGEVKSTNIATFKEVALAKIGSIKTELSTDQDFADAEVMVKALKKAEADIDGGKAQALAQTAQINDLFATMDEIKEAARQARLMLEKAVKAEKERVRIGIAEAAKKAHEIHVDNLQESISHVHVPFAPIDPLTAMKGKKTIKSLEDAADQALADGKLAANELADLVRANLTFAEKEAGDFKFLFHDMTALVVKQPDDFQAVIKARVAEHKESERLKAEQAARQAAQQVEAEAIRKAEAESQAAEAKPVSAPVEEQSSPVKAQEQSAPQTSRPATDYEQGFIDGLTAYAWWKDGIQQVGTTGTTLDQAIHKFINKRKAA